MTPRSAYSDVLRASKCVTGVTKIKFLETIPKFVFNKILIQTRAMIVLQKTFRNFENEIPGADITAGEVFFDICSAVLFFVFLFATPFSFELCEFPRGSHVDGLPRVFRF